MIATTNSNSLTSIFLMVNNFELGGTERQFALLAESLSNQKLSVHVGCVDSRGSLAENLGSVSTFPLGGSLISLQSMRSRLRLSRYLRNHRIQIAHSFDFYANLTLIPSAKLAGVPVVIGSHRQLGDLLTPGKFHAQARAFRFCDAVVCNSQAAADRLVTAGISRDKLSVIGNALQPEFFVDAMAAVPHPRPLRVGMVARMNTRRKNHAGFLRIAKQVHERMPDVQFLLIGDGPFRHEIEQQADALGLADCIAFLGVRDDVSAVLASMDVAVLTSRSESLSNAILEAMAARLPVVAYHVGGNSELLSDQRGLLVDDANESAFADALLGLLADRALRSELGENGYRFARENFRVDRVRDAYQALYRALRDKKLGSQPT